MSPSKLPFSPPHCSAKVQLAIACLLIACDVKATAKRQVRANWLCWTASSAIAPADDSTEDERKMIQVDSNHLPASPGAVAFMTGAYPDGWLARNARLAFKNVTSIEMLMFLPPKPGLGGKTVTVTLDGHSAQQFGRASCRERV